jgi:hypothetical protein
MIILIFFPNPLDTGVGDFFSRVLVRLTFPLDVILTEGFMRERRRIQGIE